MLNSSGRLEMEWSSARYGPCLTKLALLMTHGRFDVTASNGVRGTQTLTLYE
jgi:hypothetical protein